MEEPIVPHAEVTIENELPPMAMAFSIAVGLVVGTFTSVAVAVVLRIGIHDIVKQANKSLEQNAYDQEFKKIVGQ